MADQTYRFESVTEVREGLHNVDYLSDEDGTLIYRAAPRT